MLESSAVQAAGGYGPPGGGSPPGGGYDGPPGGAPPGGYGAPPGYGGPPAGPRGGGYGGPPQGGPPGYGAPPGDFGGQGTFGQAYGPAGSGPGGPKTHPLAIASLVLGILSVPLCCCSLFGMWAPIGAIVCGILGMNKIKAEPQLFTGNGLCIAGIATGGVGVLLDVLALSTAILQNVKSQYFQHV
jgi:hypothetical protein